MEEDKGMKELGEIARAYYYASPYHVKNLVTKFFQKLDNDGDGKVSLSEFLEFMRLEGHLQMKNKVFFKKLDMDKNGILDFREVRTLYYILNSGRPFCGGCGDFITGVFFACIKCFERDTDHHYCVCLKCYYGEIHKLPHEHNHFNDFMDNYLMLELKRKSDIEARARARRRPRIEARVEEHTRINYHSPSTSSTSTVTQHSRRNPPPIPTSTAIVRYRPNNQQNLPPIPNNATVPHRQNNQQNLPPIPNNAIEPYRPNINNWNLFASLGVSLGVVATNFAAAVASCNIM